jgi:peroxiredoxin
MAHDIAVLRPLALGDPLPDLRLGTADGGEVAMATFAGRPLVIVCIRYYG